jgi:hypothetical protein
MRLRANEVCPIHRSVSCCGRDRVAKPRLIRLGVQRVEDPHHPRGYLAPHDLLRYADFALQYQRTVNRDNTMNIQNLSSPLSINRHSESSL